MNMKYMHGKIKISINFVFPDFTGYPEHICGSLGTEGMWTSRQTRWRLSFRQRRGCERMEFPEGRLITNEKVSSNHGGVLSAEEEFRFVYCIIKFS